MTGSGVASALLGGCQVGHNRVCWALMLGADLADCQPEGWLFLMVKWNRSWSVVR